MERKEVYSVINDERVYQDRKWGTIEQRPKQVGAWLTLMRHILTKAESDWATSSGDYNALDEIRKLVAVGVACMEQHGAVARNPIDFASLSKDFTVAKASDVPDLSTMGAHMVSEFGAAVQASTNEAAQLPKNTGSID